MSDDFAQSVKQQVDIVKIDRGATSACAKPARRTTPASAPSTRKNRRPSPSTPSRQFFHCFGCGVSGDVFTFVGKIENVTFPEAVRIVAQKCGIPLPKREFSSPEEAAEAAPAPQAPGPARNRRRMFSKSSCAARRRRRAREYLAGRGLTPEGIKTFRIGYAPDSFNALRDRLSGMADAETLRASGLFSAKEIGTGPTASPVRPPLRPLPQAHHVSHLPTRAAASSPSPRAPSKPAKKPAPNISTRRKRRSIPRAMSSSISTRPRPPSGKWSLPCWSRARWTASPSSCADSERDRHQRHRLHRAAGALCCARHTSQVAVNFDPDAAGANAAEKSIALLTEEGFAIKIVTLEDGLDPDRYIRERGAEAYMQAIRGARRQSDYLIERARQISPAPAPSRR